MEWRDEVSFKQGRADSGDYRLLARTRVYTAQNPVLAMKPRNAFLERPDELHPIVELLFYFALLQGVRRRHLRNILVRFRSFQRNLPRCLTLAQTWHPAKARARPVACPDSITYKLAKVMFDSADHFAGRSSALALPKIIARAVARKRLDLAEAIALIQCPREELPSVTAAARTLRDTGHGQIVTYSRKVFLPVTNLCRDRCTYCTFRKDPDDPGAWTMTPDEIAQWSRRGHELGCREALMCLGDKPEGAFKEFHKTLERLGARTTIEYVARACEIALGEGLLPHTNAGLMSAAEMAMLRPLNVSMGLMLESVSTRLRGRGQVHQWAPDKDPAKRLQTIVDAGAARIPFTTGILLGIGETAAERAQSLIAIRDLHEQHGHIQEVIIQNFRSKPDIAMADAPEPDEIDMVRAIATARLVLGAGMNVQAPPNLSPNQIELFLDAGVNDWGGISPLSPDYVNPEAPWPHLERLGERCARAGFELRERLAIYPEFINDYWLDPSLRSAVDEHVASLGGGQA
jgi:FO synthase